MDDMRLLMDLYIEVERQGPGSDAHTRLAIELSGLQSVRDLQIADMGCGTGASTLVLARELDADIVAVDFLQPFLDVLQARATQAGVARRITMEAASMEAFTVAPGSLDAIWSEGAIYNIGFENGVQAWRHFLKPGGVLAVSELTWLTDRRPDELTSHWQAQYPEVGTAASKLAVLERHGYTPLGYFVLPPQCWLDAFYRPLQRRFPSFLDQHGHSNAAQALVAAEAHEIDLYERHMPFVSYGFYIARKNP